MRSEIYFNMSPLPKRQRTDLSLAELSFRTLQHTLWRDSAGRSIRQRVFCSGTRFSASPHAWDAADIATRAIRYYEQQYQILAAVHEDRPHIHIHFVMNTLNYRTGKKYPGDRADYYGFLAYLGKILKPYGLKVKLEK